MLTMKRVPLSISLLCAWLLSSADCSHFRGGSMSWKPTSNASQIDISHQMAWRRSSSSSSFCNDATIATQGTLTVSAYLYCRVGCNSSSRISLMHGKCIAYSASEDWSLGEDSFIFNVPIPGIKYTFRLEDCCWQSIRNRGSSDSMRMTMTADLRPRADTGVMNSSPVATMSPIVRLLAGCQHSFRIPVIDADNDIVRCRLPNTTFNTNECGYLCAGLPGSALDTDACVFSYNATSGTGIYGVSLYIEDFSAASPSVVLSSVPIQFLILVFSDSLACNDGPTFVSPTPPEASCHVVNTTFTTRLVARTKSAAHTITKIFLTGPTGITKSNLAPYGKSGREWSISVKWSPTQSQDGLHLVCFSAEINNKLSSGMMCFDVMKGTPPSINLRPNCLTPTGEIDSTTSNITFRMCFDKKFNRPTTNKYMIIHHSNGTEANRLNLNDPSVASFSTLDDRMVTVTLGNSSGPDLLGSGQYYIILEAGSVAAQPLSCIIEWPGITQPFYWNFTVVDRTPPSLNFVFNPKQVSDNETFSMTWTVSESLSMERCYLTTPTSSSLVNCRSYISQNNLVAGNYSIKIELEDLNGNKAGPYEHQWLVVDRTPPSLTFASNPTQVNENETFSMAWTVSESLSMERCNLTTPTSSSTVNCRGSFNQIFLDPGNYSISIELKDVNGNKAEPYEHQWIVIDRTPPSLTFVSNPTQVNDNETFSMTWTVSESLSMEHCNLTTPASSSIVNCRGSYSQNILIPGNYAISIKIEDLNGNKAGPYEHIWVVIDVTPPSLRFVLNHSLTRSNASITWTVSEPVVSSNCTVTFPNGTLVYESCIDRWEAIDLRRGPYQISIVLVDTAGHIGGPFRHTWTNIDVTPPILTFTRKPALSLSKANITWVTNEEADGVCEVQGPSSFYRSVVCDKVWSEDYLPEGEFILNVTVYDQSLNMAGPFQHKWYNRDVKPPELRLTSSPFRDKSYDNATLTWTYNEYAASTCVIKTSLTTEFAPCDNSWSGTFLPEGNVTIEIDARDKSRNSAPTYKYTWYNKDTTPPVLTFIRKEALTVNHAWITWSVNEPASANCTLTTPFTTAVFSCDSGLWSGFGLLGGSYGLGIRLLDRGNNAAGPFVHKWLNVDTIRPRVTFTKIPSKTYSNATIQWNVSEPVNGSCEIRGPANFYRNVSCNGSWVGVNLPPGSFTLGVTLIDTSGNVGGPSRYQPMDQCLRISIAQELRILSHLT
ncbi:uncharacterized protein LOC128163488 [Crassostrea angulata]|uniref:uncharacterized protein LOC128163488 n=1 Tax=Magallana angulata TaxID=2784310 RepID=UPI0022B1ADA7|nr:uncharacterized protein LOC128163488 [Crassostrea angulata]